MPLFFAAINREKGHIGIEAPLATGSGRDRDVSINVSSLTFGYEGSFDNIFEMFLFLLIQTGNWVLQEEMEKERLPF